MNVGPPFGILGLTLITVNAAGVLSPGVRQTEMLAEILPSIELPAVDKHGSGDVSAFLLENIQSGELRPVVAARVCHVLSIIRGFPGLPNPDIAIAKANQVLCFWDKAEHHFEAEIFDEGPIELFYRNRKTGQFWEEEWSEDTKGSVSIEAQVFLDKFSAI